MPKKPRHTPDPTPAQVRLRATLADCAILLLLAVWLFNTNHIFTFIDDEINMLGPAAQPTAAFFSSLGETIRSHEHPPLFDIILHFWLRATGGSLDWLRVPSLLFFLAGLFVLSRAARILAGVPGSTALIWLGALWPYGFHFARLAGWYSFAFLLIAATTWAYLRYAALLAEHADASACRWAWIRVCVLGLLLVYTNYFGWALLFLLAVDDWIRHRQHPGTLKRLLITAAIFVVAYAPLWPAFRYELGAGTTLHQSWFYRLANTAYNVYVLFISESMAPWFWKFGVPGALAILTAILFVLFVVRGPARRFLIYAALLLLLMSLGGILYPRRLFMIAPWVMLATAAAIGTVENNKWRLTVGICLGIVAGLGWYGFAARQYYATPRFFEPWEKVAQDAAETVKEGGLVVGNNPSFLFYLTYALQVPPSPNRFLFSGVVGDAIPNPQVWQPENWEQAGRPVRPRVLWVKGMPGPEQGGAMQSVSDWLDKNCAGHNDRYMARDASYLAKRRFAPQIEQLLWRIEIHDYACESSPAPSSPAPPVIIIPAPK
jgi:hypothetical protein